jgi:hypothetical protein
VIHSGLNNYRIGSPGHSSVRNCRCRGLPSVVIRSQLVIKITNETIRVETEPDMIVDCDRCPVRGGACQDCVITVLFGAPPGDVEWDDPQRPAPGIIAGVGTLSPRQLVHRHPNGAEWSATDGERSGRQVG